MLFLLVFYTSCFGSVVFASKEVDFGIYPSKISYLDQENPCYMICASGEIDIETIEWISITKNYKPVVSLLAGDEFEWGSMYRNEAERIHLNGSVNDADQAFLRLDFDYVKCGDEARYQCVIEGYDRNGTFRKYKTSEEMLVYSIHGKPKITLQSNRVENNEIEEIPGKELTLNCEGSVGKPAAPLYWLRYDPDSKTYQRETNLVVGEASLTLPLNDLCRYHRNQTLKYTTRLSEPEMMFKCQLGYYEQIFIIHTLPIEKRFSKGRLQVVSADAAGKGCRKENGEHVYTTIAATITMLFVLLKQ